MLAPPLVDQTGGHIKLASDVRHHSTRCEHRLQNLHPLRVTPPTPPLRPRHHCHLGHAVQLRALIRTTYERSIRPSHLLAKAALTAGLRLLAVHVHSADVQDRDGAKGVLKRSRARYPFVEHAFADGGYAGRLIDWTRQRTHITLQIVRRNASAKGFEVLPRRWVVERTFAWIIKNRRFVRDYEQLTPVAETLIVIAATATLIRRWP